MIMRHNRIASLKLRWLLALLLVVAGTGPLAALAQDRKAVDLPILFDTRERIAKPDLAGIVRLRFLTTVDFPPFNFIDQTGKLAGFHVDLVREICRELALTDKCQIQAVTFPELEKALTDGNGEAVAAGTMMAAELSAAMGRITSSDVQRVERLLLRAKLPVVGASMPVARYLDLMRHDKKVDDGRLRLVLLESVGRAFISDAATDEQIAAAITARMPRG